MKLTEKQKRFADYYIELGNATQAYKKAGYKSTGNAAEVNASRLLSNAKVGAYIADKMSNKDHARIASQDEILTYLTSVMRGEESEQTLIGGAMGEGQGITDIEVSAKDRVKAAELLGKRYALWTDKQKIEGNVGVVLVDDIGSDEDGN